MARTRTRSARPDSSRAASPISPEVLWYLEHRGYVVPECAPAFRTPEPREYPGAVFDPARVDRTIAAFRRMRHTQGKWAGRPLDPDPWQVAHFIAPVFGWVAPNDDGRMVRIIREVFFELPRKNGKTTIASAAALYLAFADGEPGAQVVAAAASKDQARFCYDPAKLIAEKSSAMRAGGIVPMRNRIEQARTNSYFGVVSSAGDLQHGANLHGGVVDELHVHKTPDVVDAVESGVGARDQPLIIKITTADSGKPGTVYAQNRETAERLSKGTIENLRIWAVVFAADATDDPFAEATWVKANPGYGISPTREFMLHEATKARQNPVHLARFKRLHLGLRTKQETKFFELDVWDRNAGTVDEKALAGRAAFGGLDLANTSDLCALAWDFPDDDGGHDVLWRFWLPERAFDRLVDRTAGSARVWREQGLLTVTPGDVTDYDWIKDQVAKDSDSFDVQEIAYDPWNASQLVNDLVADEAPMVKMRQGFVSMSAPTKALLHLLLSGTAKAPKYRHAANPVMRWMVDNLAVQHDPAGNVKPDRARAADKIDGVVAAVMALDRAINAEPPQHSAYDDNDLLVV